MAGSAGALPKAAATSALAAAIYVVLRYSKSTAALPSVLTAVPVIWYAGLGVYMVATGAKWLQVEQSLAESSWTLAKPSGGGQPIWKVCLLHLATLHRLLAVWLLAVSCA